MDVRNPDTFLCNKRPDFGKIGVQISDNVRNLERLQTGLLRLSEYQTSLVFEHSLYFTPLIATNINNLVQREGKRGFKKTFSCRDLFHKLLITPVSAIENTVERQNPENAKIRRQF